MNNKEESRGAWSQTMQIKKHLEKGLPITPIQALNKFNCFRLGARIWDLRTKLNMNISTTMVERNGKHFAEYKLIG